VLVLRPKAVSPLRSATAVQNLRCELLSFGMPCQDQTKSFFHPGDPRHQRLTQVAAWQLCAWVLNFIRIPDGVALTGVLEKAVATAKYAKYANGQGIARRHEFIAQGGCLTQPLFSRV
jgi:hypothetical protein